MCDLQDDTHDLPYSVNRNFISSDGFSWTDFTNVSVSSNMQIKCEPNIYVYTDDYHENTEPDPDPDPTTPEIEIIDNKAVIDNNDVIFPIGKGKTFTISDLNSLLKFNYDYKVYVNGTEVTSPSTPLGTGTKIVINDKSYYLVILGDVNKDAKISALDYIEVRKHIMGTKITDPYKLKAADSDKNNKISALDYIEIRKILMS
jgi:hypothetical protein